jgi:hypothetical protein
VHRRFWSALVIRSATISDCGRYRYDLTRDWSEGRTFHEARLPRTVCWVMLNPSTGDAEIDDPTITRCIGFSQREHFDRLVIVNLYAYRTAYPAQLYEQPEAVRFGEGNEDYVRRHIAGSELVIAAWGNRVTYGRRHLIAKWAHDAGVPLRCLGRTKSGAPRHPLYLLVDTPLEPYGAFEEGP